MANDHLFQSGTDSHSNMYVVTIGNNWVTNKVVQWIYSQSNILVKRDFSELDENKIIGM